MHAVTTEVPSTNMLLAGAILENASDLKASYKLDIRLKDIKKLVFSEGFQKDPISYLVNTMADRGLGECWVEDSARAFVIGRIPDFADRIASSNYLSSIAAERFKDHKKINMIMDCFNQSLKTKLFNIQLNKAILDLRSAIDEKDSIALERAEDNLRLPLSIFNQAEKLQKYNHNEEMQNE